MPTSGSTEALPAGANFKWERTARGLMLRFPALRAPGVALGLLAFAAVCGLIPALGLSALLPLDTGSAPAVMSLALIAGFAAPFIIACVVFTLLAIYQLANSLRVEIDGEGVRTQRRVFGCVTKRRELARADIANIEPRASARMQNLFSKVPRYALVARHRDTRAHDVIIAEDLAGTAIMQSTLTLMQEQLDLR